MILDIANVKIDDLPRPDGYAYEFVRHLKDDSDCSGEYVSFGFYYMQDVLEEAREFCKDNNLDEDAEKEIKEWVKKLPWNVNEIILQFNW